MLAILIAAPFGAGVEFLPDQGPSWYYWKRADPDWLSRAVAWGSYVSHQLAIWWLIYSAQSSGLRYRKALHPQNIAALAVNAAFVLWHVAQTRLFYDGLAQDVSVFSSLGSVALLLMLVLLMENQRRGLVLGWSAPGLNDVSRFLRRYHGYYFAWAVIYTFWYHPIEISLGHLLGTFYILMLLLQGSLFFTRAHVDRGWTTVLEAFVLLHGAVVAWLSVENHDWGRFAFGFAAIFLISQMHGLGWSRRCRWLWFTGFMLALLLVYQGEWMQGLNGALRIPIIYLIALPLIALLIRAGLGLYRRFSAQRAPDSAR